MSGGLDLLRSATERECYEVNVHVPVRRRTSP